MSRNSAHLSRAKLTQLLPLFDLAQLFHQFCIFFAWITDLLQFISLCQGIYLGCVDMFRAYHALY